ncbi:MAG TPA: hypothetical protein VLK29_11035 [Luteimonas sp.]|nr:hypothetical protein [Luteimonas sp.]
MIRRLFDATLATGMTTMLLRLALCLLLLSASLPSGARELRQLGPGGDGGGCPDTAAGGDVVEPVHAAGKRNPAAVRPKPAVTRGGDGSGVRAPRWHSFLPGMFR